MRKIKYLFISFLLLSCFTCAFAESPKREIRSAWVTTAWNNDWPSDRDLSAEKQQAELRNIIDQLHAANFNAVFLQVRSFCDAFYQSSYEPWSYYLTGTRGKASSYDPLHYAIEYAHSKGMELHAWINPYRYSSSKYNYGTLATDYATTHPDWIMHSSKDANATILNPGIPAVREQIAKVIAEIVTNYDIDGVLFDDYFYPNGATQDAEDETYFKQNNPKGLSRADWRRDQVNQMVELVYTTIKDIKPHVRFGISPAGVACTSQTVANKYGVDKCTVSSSDWQYNGIYSDPLAWISSHNLDYISPQIYWKIGAAADYDKLSKWWSNVANQFGRHFYSSHTLSSLDDWGDNEYVNQVALNRKYTQNDAPGSIFYNISNALSSTTFLDNIKTNSFEVPSLPPAMSWEKATTLAAPTNLKLSGSTLSWTHATAERFTVYAYTKGADKTAALASSSNLVGVVYGKSIDLSKVSDYASKTLAVCAYDRYGNEYEAGLYNAASTGTDNPNQGNPEEGTITIDALWTKKEAAVDYISSGNANRSLTYYNNLLYFPDYNGKLYIVNAADGSQKSVVDLGLTGYYRWNARITDDGQMLGGNTNLGADLTVYSVDKATGAATALTPTATVGGRSDYFHVYGSWKDGGYALALSNQAVNEKGSVAKVPFSASKLGTPVQITHADLPTGTSAIAVPAPDGKSFYVATQGTLPTQHNLTTGAKIDAFGTDKPSTDNTSGLGVFALQGSTYMLTPANRFGKFDIWDITDGLSSATKIATEDPALGENGNAAVIIDFCTHVEGNDAYIYVLAPNNGVAAYKFTFTPAETPNKPDMTYGDVKFYLQGGQLAVPADNEALWDVMGPQFDAYYPNAHTKYASKQDVSNISSFLYNNSNSENEGYVLNSTDIWTSDEGAWHWLGVYMMAHESTLVAGTTYTPITQWRFATDGFFKAVDAKTLHDRYGVGDWTEAGKPASWQPAYIFGNEPTKSGYTFLGWFKNAEGSGSALTTLPTSGDVYACWKSNVSTDVDNIEQVAPVVLCPTYDGVEISFAGTQLIQIYHINGMLLQSIVATDYHACSLPQGMYIIRIGNEVRKFIK